MNLVELLQQNVPLSSLLPGVRMAIVDFGHTNVDDSTLPAIAAAITQQVQQHFALPPPYGYDISATIRAAANPHDVQPEEWVIGLLAKPDQPNALGYHDQTPHGKPFIRVFPLLDAKDKESNGLSVTISHEVLEALADPNCARAAQARDGTFWAYEVCDAVEATCYEISGIKVSNFVLPAYFEPVSNLHNLKLDWMGLCKQPLEILKGGYGQWFDHNKGWQQVVHPQKSPRAYRQEVASLRSEQGGYVARTARRKSASATKTNGRSR
jgi:hypothetical protein